jgi:hypothetical protein
MALPCLALSLCVSSCSEDDSAVLNDKATKGETITFTAKVPVITDYSTRMGVDKDNLATSNSQAEPLIWLLDDRIAFNFVKYGETTGQVVEYVVADLVDGGVYCRMDPLDDNLDLEDGLYQVYVISPNLPTTFPGGAIAGTTIDMTGQIQSGGTTDFGHLADYHYQNAYTVLEIKNNEVFAGSTSLNFTNLTSLIRYHVINSFGYDVTVVNIKVGFDDKSRSPFYTKGRFDLPSDAPAIQPAGSSHVSTIGMTTAQPLAHGDNFDAFMALIPTEEVLSSSRITYTIFFTKSDGHLYKKVWSNLPVSYLNNGDIPAGTRYMQELTLQGTHETADASELVDEVEEELGDPEPDPDQPDIPSLEGYPVFQYKGYYYTPSLYLADKLSSNLSPYTQLTNDIGPSVCPDGWSLLLVSTIYNFSVEERVALFETIDFLPGSNYKGTIYNASRNFFLTETGGQLYNNIQQVQTDGIMATGSSVLMNGDTGYDLRCMTSVF